MNIPKKLINDWRFIGLLCFTLGLAPFVPEPHIVGKVRWILGGAKGMSGMDWFDFFLHGTPWLLAIRLVWVYATNRTPTSESH